MAVTERPEAAPARSRPALARLLASWTQRVTWAIVILLVLAAILAPLIAPYEPNSQDLRNTLLAPDAAHWLGTDSLGRDQLSRLLFGLRSSLFISAVTTLGVGLIGVPIGVLAGYTRGWVRTVVARLIDIGLALPSLVLALGLIAALGAGVRSTAIALTAGYIPYLARVVRSAVLRIRVEPYLDSARVSGVRPIRIAVRHVLPNVLPVTSVQLTLIFAFTIIAEAGLSFVGLGVQSPTASLGNMLSEGADYSLDLPILAVAPGVLMAVLVIGLLFCGDGLREATDPRRRR